MSEKNIESAQTYLFAFGGDGKIRAVSFTGKLSEEDTEKLLEAAGKHTYEKAGDIFRSYLDRQNLEYSDFKMKETFFTHETIMKWADMLLRSNTSEKIDKRIGSADHIYAIMDHQKWTGENRCEGCYYAAKRNVSNKTSERRRKHIIIGQTFTYDASDNASNGFFAIRKKDGYPPFHNLYISKGSPVLPTFGCVDTLALLRNIDSIRNARQAKDIAIR